ncbi:MAG: hypothetical protein CMC15_14000 [Flavobacteriaceae bacterium]|nr:hypothetical protein [Flavobacteriaceae bacterium]|tara:strand:+ start:4955 stop:5320 length:366 start_codon:yes stop_codon:yes gene_type:complete
MKPTNTQNKVTPSRLTLEFLQFHKENPHIYELFSKFAFVVARNHNKFGSRAILERIRWETNVESNHPALKIPNAYSAFYSRLFEIDHPRYDGLFQHNNSIANELYDIKIIKTKDAQLCFKF